MLQDPKARYALLCGKRDDVVRSYVELYAEYLRTRRELMAALDYMRQTGVAPDVLKRIGG